MSVDLWGNVTPLIQSTAQMDNTNSVDADPKTAEGESGGVELQVGPMPMFLIDIDAYLAQLRASVGVDDPRLESSFKPHLRRLHFTNPYRTAISGMVRLRPPPGWTLNPPTFAFSLNPGETFDRELTIEFPYNSFAGSKTIKAEFSVQADKNSTFTVPVVLKLGLSDVGLQTLALRDGNDVIVQQIITNYRRAADRLHRLRDLPRPGAAGATGDQPCRRPHDDQEVPFRQRRIHPRREGPQRREGNDRRSHTQR